MLKERWFRNGVHAVRCTVANIDEITGGQDVYFCPLCLEGHTDAAIDDGRLTLEHAPPANVGGHFMALTCKDCNSTAGHALDVHMQRHEDHIAFVSGKETRTIRATSIHEGNEVRGNLRRAADGSISFEHVAAANNPANIECTAAILDRWVTEGADGRTFQLRFDELLSPQRAALGWTRAAYVVAFAFFGYRYILQPVFDRLREQIARPLDEVLARLPITSELSGDPARRHLALVERPVALRSVVVGMGRHTVFLPPAGAAGSDFFDTLEARVAQLPDQHVVRREPVPRLRLTGKEIPWPTGPVYVLDG
jgi:hypothetical protein